MSNLFTTITQCTKIFLLNFIAPWSIRRPSRGFRFKVVHSLDLQLSKTWSKILCCPKEHLKTLLGYQELIGTNHYT